MIFNYMITLFFNDKLINHLLNKLGTSGVSDLGYRCFLNNIIIYLTTKLFRKKRVKSSHIHSSFMVMVQSIYHKKMNLYY